ncbi:hypothetical protein B1813_04450 [Saccharomonospora piscinae]|uniref:WXG repeat protein n=1 Tax=Saccharomonospora piscinae TaxID=687388 RepID=A0A1V9AA35_SACPI|nr:hypothetical protein [Saccharomonospora piscinae]OQO93784.1 hypothetical protein B1813_04450 [Saccharomonospora piscinae]TLW94945.1 hypothetical protein FFT09_03590 [Saccharomonospora piscinae]
MSDPSAALTDPQASDPIPDLLENVIGISQYISVSYWVGQAIDAVFDVNPFEWVAQEMAGDWEAVQRAGIALKNLGEFSAEYANSITTACGAVAHDWQGNAADSANEYFTGLAGTVGDQQQSLEAMGGDFETTAVGMYEAAAAIKASLEMLMDLLIALGLELAAAAASSWTVIGPVLSGAAAVATVSKALGVWGDVLQAHTIAWNSAQGLVGLVAGYLGTLDDLEKHALPESNYDHPGV